LQPPLTAAPRSIRSRSGRSIRPAGPGGFCSVRFLSCGAGEGSRKKFSGTRSTAPTRIPTRLRQPGSCSPLAAYDGRDTPRSPAAFFPAFRGNLAILAGTVRCGNGLVGPAIADDESWAFCFPRERHAIKPFAWEEPFSEIILPGGFDAVISSPPDRPVPDREWLRRYFQRHYAVYDPEAGLSSYVIEKSLAVLRPCGVAGIVTGGRWLHARPGTALRSLVLTRQPLEIVTAGDDACFLLLENTRPSRPFTVRNTGPDPVSADAIRKNPGFPVDPRDLSDGGWTLRDTRREHLMEKICKGKTPLGTYVLGEIRYENVRGPAPAGERSRERIRFSPSGFPPHFVLARRRAVFGRDRRHPLREPVPARASLQQSCRVCF